MARGAWRGRPRRRAGPARRPWPRSRRSACRWSSCRIPTPAGHQLANARVLADAGARPVIEDEAFDGAALLAATAILDDPGRARRGWPPRAGRSDGRARPTRWPSSSSPAAERRALPDTAHARPPVARRRRDDRADDRRDGGGRGHGRPAFDAIALGTDIQRRLGVKTSRDEPLARFTTMRVGGPADLFAVAHNAFELRGLVKFARSRGLPHVVLGRGSNIVIADAGIRGLVIQDRAEGAEIADGRLVAEAGLPMARAATVTQAAGLSGLEFGLAIPGSVGGAVWANAGAHGADVAAILESALVLLADGSERRLPAAELGLAYRESRFKTAGRGAVAGAGRWGRGSGRDRPRCDVPLEPAEPDVIKERLDDIRHWRQAHQPLGIPSAGSVFRNPPDGPSAGALIEGLGLKGATEGGATRQPEARQLHRQRSQGDGGRRAPPRRAGPGRGRPGDRHRARVRGRVPRRLGGLGRRRAGRGAAGRGAPMSAPDRPPIVVLLGGPSAEHDVSIVSGNAIADALADAGHAVTRVVIDLAGRWWWLPADHRRGDRAPAAYDDPGSLGAEGPFAVGAAIDRLAAGDPAPVVFIALHGPFGRGRDGPGAARGGRPGLHRVRCRGVGPGDGQGAVQAARPRTRAAGRRLARDPGRALGAPIATRSSASSRRSRPGPATPGS